MTSHIGLRGDKVTLEHLPRRIFMLVRHDDVSLVRFNLKLWSQFGPKSSEDKVLTMRRVSQSVPLPFRNTSSGLSGIMVQRAKMKGCTYFMYR